jgi:DNA-binding MarR family transcriptional regulator/GNAT superfamily N-acetyltransferase
MTKAADAHKPARAPSPERVAAVRAFNRFYTNVIGLLREGLLRTPYSLTEARVIFELAQGEGTELAEVRRELDIDAGYMTRILARFEADGLIEKERSATDRRRHLARLTPRGRSAFAMLDRRSAEEVGVMLSRLGEDEERRLVGAMGAIRGILEYSRLSKPCLLRPPRAGDFGWVIHRHGALYAEEYGWDESFEALVARIIAEYVENRDPGCENAWIAELDGGPVGSVYCVKKDERIAQLRLLLVEPHARGMGIGTQLVEQCVDFARQAGYERIMLWTNDVLDDARRIYERTGFRLEEEEPHHSFGQDLVGQNWGRGLT